MLSIILVAGFAAFAQNGELNRAQGLKQPFQEGCCVNSNFRRPTNVSQATISKRRLLEVLNCATNNRFIGGTRNVAKALRTGDVLDVAYYYGTYMPEQNGPALSVAVYSEDRQHGILFDVDWDKDSYFVENLPPLLRSTKQWRVGEINGGLWSYSRLWYLAQEVGTRPTQRVTLKEIAQNKPTHCSVFVEDETNWKPEKEKYVGESVDQVTVK